MSPVEREGAGARGASSAALRAGWPRGLCGVALFAFERVDSTQSIARRIVDRMIAEDEEPPAFVVAALEQSAGRGRRGRSWESARGLGIWATAVVRAPRTLLPSIPMRAGVALADVCREVGADARVKWPNDLVVGGRKLGGLLVDVVGRGDGDAWALVGFGVDCSHRAEELPGPNATSLALANGGRPMPALADLLPRFVAALLGDLGADSAWLERYRQLSVHREGDLLACELEGERVEGRFAGFDGSGFLRLRTAAGERTLSSGDVFSW